MLIEPPAGLDAEVTGVDQLTHPAVDVEAVAVALVEVLGDVHDRVDPEKMIAARAAGMSVDELHRRAYAGEFPPSKPMDPRVLM